MKRQLFTIMVFLLFTSCQNETKELNEILNELNVNKFSKGESINGSTSGKSFFTFDNDELKLEYTSLVNGNVRRAIETYQLKNFRLGVDIQKNNDPLKILFYDWGNAIFSCKLTYLTKGDYFNTYQRDERKIKSNSKYRISFTVYWNNNTYSKWEKVLSDEKSQKILPYFRMDEDNDLVINERKKKLNEIEKFIDKQSKRTFEKLKSSFELIGSEVKSNEIEYFTSSILKNTEGDNVRLTNKMITIRELNSDISNTISNNYLSAINQNVIDYIRLLRFNGGKGSLLSPKYINNYVEDSVKKNKRIKMRLREIKKNQSDLKLFHRVPETYFIIDVDKNEKFVNFKFNDFRISFTSENNPNKYSDSPIFKLNDSSCFKNCTIKYEVSSNYYKYKNFSTLDELLEILNNWRTTDDYNYRVTEMVQQSLLDYFKNNLEGLELDNSNVKFYVFNFEKFLIPDEIILRNNVGNMYFDLDRIIDTYHDKKNNFYDVNLLDFIEN